jgi:excisionase family DNA binding protein
MDGIDVKRQYQHMRLQENVKQIERDELITRQETLLLRGAEVAKALGVSRALAYRMMQRGDLPVIRVRGGKTVRVPRAALLEWIKNNTSPAEISL